MRASVATTGGLSPPRSVILSNAKNLAVVSYLVPARDPSNRQDDISLKICSGGQHLCYCQYKCRYGVVNVDWQTGKYIVEFEQGGKERAAYGKELLVNLSKDLTRLHGKGFNRSNLTYMRKLYLAFPKCGTLSHKLTWSHYYEILKCDDPMVM